MPIETLSFPAQTFQPVPAMVRSFPPAARQTPAAAEEVLDFLIAGKATVRCLLARYRALCESHDAQELQRGGLARRLCAELAVQLQIEDEVFYPALRAALPDTMLVDVAEVEHEALRELASRVVEMAPSDPMFDARMLVIGELLEMHLAREAHELHPAALGTSLDFHDIAMRLAQRRDDLLAEMAEAGASPTLRFENEEADPVGEPPR